ncbi:hypothetical protein BHE74_00043938 [Ensete ventricosum]|nr:hypothetical protein BHE74_00043938 [Ensete ventricosum]
MSHLVWLQGSEHLCVSSGQQRRKQGEEAEEKQQPRRKQLAVVWGLQQLLRRSQHDWAVAVSEDCSRGEEKGSCCG